MFLLVTLFSPFPIRPRLILSFIPSSLFFSSFFCSVGGEGFLGEGGGALGDFVGRRCSIPGLFGHVLVRDYPYSRLRGFRLVSMVSRLVGKSFSFASLGLPLRLMPYPPFLERQPSDFFGSFLRRNSLLSIPVLFRKEYRRLRQISPAKP